MGSADLDNLVEFFRFAIKRLMEPRERGSEVSVNCFRCRDMDGRWNDVVAGLAQIHMVVRMHEFAAPDATKQFRGAVRYHLVGIHVGRGAGAGLENINREL